MDESTEVWDPGDPFSWLRLFRNREHAGAQLASRLEALHGQELLVLGIPRGGVPVAAQVARRLDADLDVVVARKLGAPYQPELALGAVTSDGWHYLNKALIEAMAIAPDVLQQLIDRETAKARGLASRLRGNRPSARVEGRTVIIVDDGLATGATMRAAIRSVRTQRPSHVIVAVPVGAADTCEDVRDEVEEVIALCEPEPFVAVGAHYADFRPTSEHEVQQLLLEHPPRDWAAA